MVLNRLMSRNIIKTSQSTSEIASGILNETNALGNSELLQNKARKLSIASNRHKCVFRMSFIKVGNCDAPGRLLE